MSQAQATSVLYEKLWCSEYGSCNGKIFSKHSGVASNTFDIAKSGVILLDQFGFQGLESPVYATHTFYLYNSDGIPNYYTLKATLCDMRNICFFYEKKIKLDWKEMYSETVNSSLTVSSNNIGREPITASTEIIGYPYDIKNKEASLSLSPFPYDK